MTDRELMQQALDALSCAIPSQWSPNSVDKHREAAETLRARLAQPEPDSRRIVYCDCGDGIMPNDGAKCGTCVSMETPQREWVGLSTAETKVLWSLTKKPREYAQMIEAKLKERNYG